MKTVLLAPLALVCLSGCAFDALTFKQNEAASIADAGRTQVAVLSVEPWSKVRKELAPGFNVDAATAYQAALPRTSAFEEKLLDIFAAKFQVAPPGTSTTVKKEENLETGAISGQKTTEEKPGVLPGDDVIPARPTSRTVSGLPGLPDAAKTSALAGNDPLLRYQAAATIYQYVKVIDRMVENTPQIEGYTPYLVTFQISSLPFARHQPYDVYLDMTFYPGVHAPKKAKLPAGRHRSEFYKTPIIYPVLITDNLEGQSVSRAAELIRQISLAANILSGGFAAGLGINAVNEKAAAVFGTDLTSTFTIGKSSENGLTAILGAPRNPVSDYAMVRRTHNVSVLMLVPDVVVDAPCQLNEKCEADDTEIHALRQISLIISTELRRPDKPGDVLLTGVGPESFAKIVSQLQDRNLIQNLGEIVNSCKKGDYNSLNHVLTEIYQFVSTANYASYVENMANCHPDYKRPDVLYHAVATIFAASPLDRTTTIPIPKKPKKGPTFQVNGNQAVAAFDIASEQAMRVALTGVVGKAPEDLTATLTLNGPSGATPFVASEIEGEPPKLVLRFPSAAALGVQVTAGASHRLKLSSGVVTPPTPPATKPTAGPLEFTSVIYHAAPKKAEQRTGNAAKPANVVISAGAAGELTMTTTAGAEAKK